MIIGVLSDAHGNYIGLQRCLTYLKSHSDEIFFLGDAVGYFPFPNEVIDMLRQDNVKCIAGNHDAMLLGSIYYEHEKEPIYKMLESKGKITPENTEFLKKLLPKKEITVDGKKILFVHGSPLDPLNGYIYPDTDLSDLNEQQYDIIFMGHTHRSFIRETNGKKFVNVGSCGFSRDNGNKLTVALYDTVRNEVKLKNFIIDKEKIIEAFSPFIHSSVINVLNRNNIYEA